MGRRGPQPKPFECREELFWYLVGLIATDGCLLSRRNTVVVTSAEKKFIVDLQRELGGYGRIHEKMGGFGHIGFDLVIQRAILYQRLQEIGLTPRKSLTIGALRVPDKYFHEFVRGVIDGDGNIRRWIHPTNGREQWTIRISSASRPFLAWLQKSIIRLWQLSGAIHENSPAGKERAHSLFVLKYGKLAAKVITARCYYAGAFALSRKRIIAEQCVRTSVGWGKSKTVSDRSDWAGWNYVHVWSKESGAVSHDGYEASAGFLLREHAGVSELADDTGLKPVAPEGACGFNSHPRHFFATRVDTNHGRLAQLVRAFP